MDHRVRVDRDELDGLALERLRLGEACCQVRRDVPQSQDAHRNQGELRDRLDHRQSRDVLRVHQDLLRDRLGRCGWDASGDVRRVPSDASRDHLARRIHQDHRYRGEDARR